MEQYKIDFESMKWETPAVGVRFKAIEQAGRKLRIVEFAKDFVEPDWCKKGHIGLVLEGKLKIDFNGKVIDFHSGNGIFIPMGEKHKHNAMILTETVKLILVEDA